MPVNFNAAELASLLVQLTAAKSVEIEGQHKNTEE